MPYPIIGNYLPSTYQKYVPQAFDNSLDLYEQMTSLIAFLNGVVDGFDALSAASSADLTSIQTMVATLDQTVTDFQADFQNSILPDNLAAILEAWDTSGRLAQMISGSVFNSKLNQVETALVMQTNTYAEGTLVQTAGFSSLNDGGAARYVVRSGQVANGKDILALSNGLCAVLQIQDQTVKIEQLGGKGDYVKATNTGTDNRPIILRAFEIADTLTAEQKDYYLADVVAVTGQKHIEGHNATFYTYDKDAFTFTGNPKTRPSLRNVTISNAYSTEATKSKTAITVGAWADWGSAVTLDNVYIYDFHIGVKTFDAHACELSNVYPSSCNIGIYIGGTYGNANRLDGCFAYVCKYGFVIEAQKNLEIRNCTVENTDVAFVLDGPNVTDNITLTNPWAENVRVSVYEYATINLDTLALTYVGKTNQYLTVTNPRYENISDTGAVVYPNPFRNAFQSLLKVQNLLALGFEYVNRAGDYGNFKDYSSGSFVYGLADTPFNGSEKVLKGTGLTGGFGAGFTVDQTMAMTPGRVYLIQCAIKASQSIGLYAYLDKGKDTSIVGSTAKVIDANTWTDYSTLVKNGDLSGTSGNISVQFGFFSYNGAIPTNMDITRLQVVDVTDLFGLGQEPDVSLNEEIQSYFPYVGFGQTGRTFESNLDRGAHQPVTLLNGWTGTCNWRRMPGGQFEISGSLGTGDITNGVQLASLPVLLAPSAHASSVAQIVGVAPYNQVALVKLNTNGNLHFYNPWGATVAANSPGAALTFCFIV